MMRLSYLLLIILPINLYSQSIKHKGIYNLNISDKYSYNSSNFEKGFVDIYTVYREDSLPKYLIYVIKSDIENKLSYNELKNDDKLLRNITYDLKCDILQKQEKVYNKRGIEMKVQFLYKDKIMIGRLFVLLHRDTLYRLLFMMPHENYFDLYYNNITEILNSFKLN